MDVLKINDDDDDDEIVLWDLPLAVKIETPKHKIVILHFISNIKVVQTIAFNSLFYLTIIGEANGRVAQVRTLPTFGNLTWVPPKIV